MSYVYHNEATSRALDRIGYSDNFGAGRHIGIALVQGIRSIGNQHDIRVENGQIHGLYALSADQMYALFSHALLSGLSSEPTKDEYHQTHSC